MPWRLSSGSAQKLDSLKPGLPQGVEIVSVYDRGTLIERAVDNLKEKLIEESIVAGLLPIFYGTGTGFDVMQRIAGPMVGGMITTTVLCLLVLPVVYGLVLQLKERRCS